MLIRLETANTMSSVVDNMADPTSNQPKTKNKNKQQRQPRPPPLKPKLFHDQFSSELGERVNQDPRIFDPCAHDPVTILGRLSKSSSAPNLRAKAISEPQESITTLEQPAADTSSLSSRFSLEQEPKPKEKTKPKRQPKYDGSTFNLDHFAALAALNALIERHGRISHMGILDPSYSFFMNQARNAALYYKVKNKIAVVGGDPLCTVEQIPALLKEFDKFRKKHGLGLAFLGALDRFAEYARAQKGWVLMKFGRERALNPMTNKVLKEEEGKRIVKQCKQLLDPKRGGVRVNIYVPWQKQDLELQAKLMDIYQGWMKSKNTNGKPQAYMTVFDPFALPHLMVYIYTTDAEGKPNGFAALRMMSGGYHIDPYCALPDAPRGTSDLLIFAAMSLLQRAGISYLGLGFEPAEEVEDIHGLSSSMAQITRSAYRRTFSRLPISGKRAFHDKWHPDEAYDAGLHIIYPEGRPSIRHSLATMHFANVCVREIVKAELGDMWKNATMRKDTQSEDNSISSSTQGSSPQIDSVQTILPPPPKLSRPSSVYGSESDTGSNLSPLKTSPLHSGLYSASQVSLIVGIGSRIEA